MLSGLGTAFQYFTATFSTGIDVTGDYDIADKISFELPSTYFDRANTYPFKSENDEKYAKLMH